MRCNFLALVAALICLADGLKCYAPAVLLIRGRALPAIPVATAAQSKATAATEAAAATELQPRLSCMRSNYSTFKCFAGNFIAAHRHHHRRVCHSPGTEQTSSQINHLGLPQCSLLTPLFSLFPATSRALSLLVSPPFGF